MEIIEKAPAKINLGIDVLYKREDGYCELEMVMASVDLSDYITVCDFSQPRIKLKTNSGFLPLGKKNLVYKAAKILLERFSVSTGVVIDIDKQIPVSAGLAGGSSDCAATLRALNKLWKLNLTLEELASIGAELGSDVPYCLYGNTAFVRGRGEIVEKIADIKPFWLVLVKPPKSVPTASIFQVLDIDTASHPDIYALRTAINEQNFKQMFKTMDNVLEPVTIKRIPEIQKIKNTILSLGAKVALMSGSGPTVFGICENQTRAKRVFNGVKGFNSDVYLTRLLTH
ncbi:MAG: 4-(cytidine 5'-diphospho)-2-C-methyl-D-erythritol kinase [Streptococcaceae bacterium]|jgi:4-diphosphocytidyl-2C-methyl-D-erythritol kinase|nr:4-(cytidine 5'-diphospho)-2-C-methyl-D-erythritol kinase [Streptococcaceae bacterium]